MVSEYILTTNKLTKRYGKKFAVDNIDIKIRKGDIYGFIGKNGAGKTTTIKMVVGIIKPTSGEIELFGSKNLLEGQSKIGTVIEYPALYPYMSARENLEVQRLLLGIQDKKIIDEILKIVGLDTVGNKKAKNFSLGMKQRLAIALALMGKPEFLFLDEPINGLDPIGIKEIRDLILNLNKEHGITIMISSHILGELSKIATCYGVISDGVLVDQFTAEELKTRVKRNIKVKVNNTDRAFEIIKNELGVSKCEISDGIIIVYDDLKTPGDINKILYNNDIVIESISINDSDYEDYFIKLMGGTK